MYGTILIDAHLLGTSLKLAQNDRVHLTPATNQPNSEGKMFARPLHGKWSDGIKRNLDDSILLHEGEYKLTK
jgi:hypothetical protein